jgi:hypothetical protein
MAAKLIGRLKGVPLHDICFYRYCCSSKLVEQRERAGLASFIRCAKRFYAKSMGALPGCQ